MSKHFKEKFIKITQPVGDLYLVNLKASDVIDISESETRKPYNATGIQRRLEPNRVNAIAKFCESNDAMFPTPIILSASSDNFKIIEESSFLEFDAPEENKYFSIVDGQHRLAGIKKARKEDSFDLLIAFIFDTDASQDARLFSIINGNQKPVSKSLIYDLYGLSEKRTVEKTCNTIIRYLNNNEKSEMSGRIKLLGYKDELSPNGTVSQATMMEGFIGLISKYPEQDNLDIEYSRPLSNQDTSRYIFRDIFISEDDEMLIRHALTFFNSWISTIEKTKNRYGYPDFMLFEKSIGFATSFKVLQILFYDNERRNDTLYSYYVNILSKIFDVFFNLGLHKKTYSSSKSGVSDLFKDLCAICFEFNLVSEEAFDTVLPTRTNNDIRKLLNIYFP